MRNNFYVIGGQYYHYCYGCSHTIAGAKLLSAKSSEYWDNWLGWHRPAIYAAQDCHLAKTEFFGTQMIPNDGAIPIMVYDMNRKKWISTEEV